VENKTEIMQHVLKIPLLPKNIKRLSTEVFLRARLIHPVTRM